MNLRPPVPYYGGKMLLARRIVGMFPQHVHYVEPFAGSLAVLLAKPRSPMETVNDLDTELMTFWRVVRDRPAELARTCALTPHARAEQQGSYEMAAAADDVEVARRIWVQLSQGRAGVRTRTGWRHYVDPAGSHTSMPDYLDGYVRRIHGAAERLAGVSLEARPALDLIKLYGRSPDVLLYLDPPYLGTSRASRGYRHEMQTQAEHRDLADALHDTKAAVVLSGYPSPLYDHLYAGWHRHELATNTGQGGTRADRVEVIWTNRPTPTQLLLNSEVTTTA